MTEFFCKLRANLVLAGDVTLAQRELNHFFAEVELLSAVTNPFWLDDNCRKDTPFGFHCRGLQTTESELVLSVAFIQEIWRYSSENSPNVLNPAIWWREVEGSSGRLWCLIPAMAMSEILSYVKVKADAVTPEMARSLAAYLAGETTDLFGFQRALQRQNSSTPHVHGLHKYKAKFFPRMARSLIATWRDRVPKTNSGKITLLDPFVGSGTALVEAYLLGIDAIGIDLDRLSCLISEAKVNVLGNLSTTQVQTAIGEVLAVDRDCSRDRYHFPPWIAKKFAKKNQIEAQLAYETEIAQWRNAIKTLGDPTLQNLLFVCFSDALSRKFNIRMMGTGVNRFALEIQKKSITTLVTHNFQSLLRAIRVCETLHDTYPIHSQIPQVRCGNATAIPLEDNSISMVLTSPPYLPASSGRENYLMGKSIANTALNLMTVAEIEAAEALSLGSMQAQQEIDLNQLPFAVTQLYIWLKNDELRSIKAAPVYHYYNNLKRALQETYRVLIPGGIAIYVIGKESVFYTYKTREIIYRVECDRIFAEIAESCGFAIVDKIDVQLSKSNRNARPRSLDDYYESILCLQKCY